MLETKKIIIKTQAGEDKEYILSKIPYMSGGREICTQFLPTAMPKIGEYSLNEALSVKMFAFIAVEINGEALPLSTRALIDNHVPDFQTGLKLEKEMLEYNFGFFDQGKISAFLKTLSQKGVASILPILIQLRDQLSQKDAQP